VHVESLALSTNRLAKFSIPLYLTLILSQVNSFLSKSTSPTPFGPKDPTHFDPSILKFRLDTATNEP
jgi:hypothetical protein